jgi:hypothetical protein
MEQVVEAARFQIILLMYCRMIAILTKVVTVFFSDGLEPKLGHYCFLTNFCFCLNLLLFASCTDRSTFSKWCKITRHEEECSVAHLHINRFKAAFIL